MLQLVPNLATVARAVERPDVEHEICLRIEHAVSVEHAHFIEQHPVPALKAHCFLVVGGCHLNPALPGIGSGMLNRLLQSFMLGIAKTLEKLGDGFRRSILREESCMICP